MAKLVADYGSLDAKLCLIGDFPLDDDLANGKPFAGTHGWKFDQWWEQVQLHRNHFYLSNVYQQKVFGNEIWSIGKEAVSSAREEFHRRIARLSDPYVLVPTGDFSLNTLMRTEFGEQMRLQDWRGSILSYTDNNGRRIKVIPTIHAAKTFPQPILTKFCIADWKRIAGDCQFRELRLPQYKHIIDPSNEQVEKFIKGAIRYNTIVCGGHIVGGKCCRCGQPHKPQDFCDHPHSPPPAMAIDVENSMNGDYFKELTCVGFSFEPSVSMSISTLRNDYSNDTAYRYSWNAINTLCSLPIAKVLQNGLTDIFKLKRYGVEVNNYLWDLMEMDHALDPNDGGDTEKGSEEAYRDKSFKMKMRSLGVLQSIYSRAPYHKLMAKSFDRSAQLVYNGLDCCVEREIYEPMWLKLKERGLV